MNYTKIFKLLFTYSVLIYIGFSIKYPISYIASELGVRWVCSICYIFFIIPFAILTSGVLNKRYKFSYTSFIFSVSVLLASGYLVYWDIPLITLNKLHEWGSYYSPTQVGKRLSASLNNSELFSNRMLMGPTSMEANRIPSNERYMSEPESSESSTDQSRDSSPDITQGLTGIPAEQNPSTVEDIRTFESGVVQASHLSLVVSKIADAEKEYNLVGDLVKQTSVVMTQAQACLFYANMDYKTLHASCDHEYHLINTKLTECDRAITSYKRVITDFIQKNGLSSRAAIPGYVDLQREKDITQQTAKSLMGKADYVKQGLTLMGKDLNSDKYKQLNALNSEIFKNHPEILQRFRP